MMKSVVGNGQQFKAAYILPLVEIDDHEVGVLFLHRQDPVIDSAGNELYPAGVLDLPGGTIDKVSDRYEDPPQAAIREFQEETGLVADKAQLVPIVSFKSVDMRYVQYYGYPITQEEMNQVTVCNGEHNGFVLVRERDIPDLIRRNEILDIHADVALYWLTGEPYLNGRDFHLDTKIRAWWTSEIGKMTRSSVEAEYRRFPASGEGR